MKIRILQIIAVAVLAVALPQLAKADLLVQPASQSVAIGNQAIVDIVITGLGNGAAPALAGFNGLLVAFDQTILQPASVSFTSRLGDPTDPAQTLLLFDLFYPGSVLLDGFSFLSSDALYAAQANPNSQFSILAITFDTIGTGISGLNLTYGALSDESGDPLNPLIQNGSITVTSSTPTVPEPGTWVLLTTVLGIGFVKRRSLQRTR